MKKFFAVPLAVLFVAACSDSSTAPASSTADLTPSYAKPGSGGGTVTPAQTVVGNYKFDVGTVDISSGTGIGADTDDQTQASNAADLQFAPADPDNGFVGRFNNTHTRALAVFNTAGSKYTIDFDLYVIGSWDGKGKQAQNGAFLANVFQVGVRCGSNPTVTPLFTTTFSNQKTVQQDFPAAFGLGGNKYLTGSVAGSADALGYRGAKDANGNLLSNTPTFQSVGDVTYHMTYTITSAQYCGSDAPTFVFSSTAPGQQSNYDESWGLDNIVMKMDPIA
jgi:hypothetical protein